MDTLKPMLVHLTEELRGDTDRMTQGIGPAVRRAGPRGPESPEDANRRALRSVLGALPGQIVNG